MEYKHIFKRFLQRIAIDISRKMDYRSIDKSSHGKECFTICQKLISNPESELIVSPLTAKRYIKNDESSIFVIIQGRTVQIINHIYSYSIHLDDKTYERVIATFNHEQEKRCVKLESEAEVNIKHSLKNIINNLQK
jgi:hypothetical protein